MTDDTIDLDPEDATEHWRPEPVGFKVRDRDVDAGGVREVLARPLGSKALVITRRSVEGDDTSGAVRFFEACGAGRAAALANVGRVVVAVEGYDDDPRELWQIPPARRFFARLWRAVPHLLFFLLPEGPTGQVGSALFLALMLHPDPRGGPSGAPDGKWYMRIDGSWLATGFLEPGFAAMNAFAVRHGLAPSAPTLRALVGRLDKQLRASLTTGTLQ
jgi:hypothetical protein